MPFRNDRIYILKKSFWIVIYILEMFRMHAQKSAGSKIKNARSNFPCRRCTHIFR
ncbi:hypothetical protein GYH30_052270 [Glycine max]|uniref:Uncharacterized protein n=1 Tax=Glycine max TaxID=3847 RepID=K7MX00_SOYBN|nr:hypothetical protein GYH30_052270 [Glycine max]